MASADQETIHKQTFFINDLVSRSVTLYPTRAAIVRDIEDVKIEPGRNEITILGLTQFADENSIKIEGHGTDALITDMLVDRRRNNRYDDASDTDSSDSDEQPPENPELEKTKKEIETFQQEIGDAEENVRSTLNQLGYLDQHTSNLCLPPNLDSPILILGTKEMAENLETYGIHREKLYCKYKEAQVTLKRLKAAMIEKQVRVFKLEKAQGKSQRKAKKLSKEKDEERLEKREQKIDRPQWVQRIRVTIESNSLPTNTPSVPSAVSTGRPARREDDEPPTKSRGPSLRISYITTGASWTPRYDLRLDTTSGTGILTYRAQFLNQTGELWRDASITLSTSQTSFGGLEDKVPLMDMWRVTLRKRANVTSKDDGLYSQKEKEINEDRKRQKEAVRNVYSQAYKPMSKSFGPTPASFHSTWRLGISPGDQKPSGNSLFGVSQTTTPAGLFGQVKQSNAQEGGLFGVSQTTTPTGLFGQVKQSNAQEGGLFGGGGVLPPSGDAFSNNAASNPFPSSGRGGFGGSSADPPLNWGPFGSTAGPLPAETDARHIGGSGAHEADSNNRNPYDSDSESDAATLNQSQKMGFTSSTPSSYGLTTTYDLSGTRTISSSLLIRRHVIAEYFLPDVGFSHIALPKLRAAAFLKAKIKNPASTPLLRGPVGLTLDGSFLGNGIVPRCAPKDTFELGLGVDEEVLVEYRRPVKRMASQGMLVKEQVATFERGIRVYNARRNAIKLVLFDQVPVSEDDRLRIVIVKPKGLRNVGDVVRTSVDAAGAEASVKSSGSGSKQGGEIVAELQKGGGIRYEVSLEKGDNAVLPLEYEARLPAGEAMIGL